MLQASFNYRLPGLAVRDLAGLCIVIVALGYMLVSEGIEVAVQRSGSAGADAAVDTPGSDADHRRRDDDRERRVVSQDAAPIAAAERRRVRDVVLSIDDLVVDFPLERTDRARGRRSVADDPAGPAARRRRRVGLGQVDGRAWPCSGCSSRRGRITRRLDQARRARARAARRRTSSARVRGGRDRDDLPGRARLAQPGQDDRLPAASRRSACTRDASEEAPSSARSSCSPRSASRPRATGSTSTRTSSPAACASA